MSYNWEGMEVGGYLHKLLHIYFCFHFYFYTSKWKHVLQLRGVEVGLLFAEALWLSFNSCRFCNSDLHWEQLFSNDSHKMPKMLLLVKCPKCFFHKMTSELVHDRTQNSEQDWIRDLLQEQICAAHFHQLLLLQLCFTLKQIFPWNSPAAHFCAAKSFWADDATVCAARSAAFEWIFSLPPFPHTTEVES